jgi:hypothetical protein
MPDVVWRLVERRTPQVVVAASAGVGHRAVRLTEKVLLSWEDSEIGGLFIDGAAGWCSATARDPD